MAVGLLALVVIGGSAFLIQVFRSPEEVPPSVATALTPSYVRIPTVTPGETSATAIDGIIGQPPPSVLLRWPKHHRHRRPRP